MKFHPGHKTKTGGHEFSINASGTAVQLTLAGGSPVAITGAEAKELRSWLGSAELRTDDEHAAVLAKEKENPTQEINSGFKVELQKGSNEHVHVATLEEATALRAKIDAIDAANDKAAKAKQAAN